ncbi:MAG: hypothetical protein HYZ87_01860 [Candidatus Omnitrophica bacterium]|nr:hypothetical protein [Candidatus Omnitrophota bacterium]
MRVAIYCQNGDPSHVVIAESLGKSIRKQGDTFEFLPIRKFQADQIRAFDAVITYHITLSKPIMDACLKSRVHVIYYDKGYTHRGWRGLREKAYYRFSVNAFHPLHYFQSRPRPSDRWQALGIELKKPSQKGKEVIFAGCSQKFAAWYGLDITEYAQNVIAQIQKHTRRPIVYRPKKSAVSPPPIPGTRYSHREQKIEHELERAHALVTFSSNAAVDAIIAGIPAFVLGPSIARPVSNTDLSKIENPYFPSDKERLQWCSDLAYCQWRFDEIECGAVWESLKEVMSRPESKPQTRQNLSEYHTIGSR